ncbi:MAG: hypothetical protein FRX49_06819 [Trebouxia sp. A1-2]|nr:MAG: hypothetical protein FRX49_06819 [Trebouxia sp. A1-2]
MEFTAEQFSDVAGLSLAFDPLDSFEDLCAELDTGATTGVFATGSQAINAYFDTPSDAVSAAAANVAPAATRAPRKKKQRNLVNARNAQRRFRERQKACVNAEITDPANSYVAFDQVQSESILGQLSVTTAELRELKSRQQHLEARNVLLEKVAELNTVQQSGNWGEQQAVLDFACAHTQPTEQGHALTLTIWGQAECTSARSVSNMSIPEITSLWTEYVRRLGTLLVGLQEDPQAPDRPCLDTWVAEARALICCIRAYNPEALKKLETSSLISSVSVEQDLSTSFCTQQLELMMLSEGQVQDLLYLYQLENARVAQLKAQREAAVSKLMGNSQSADAILKQHPSDSITVSNDVLTSMQSALALVHSYPLFMHPEPLLDALAQQHGQAATSGLAPEPHMQDAEIDASWALLAAYAVQVCSADFYDYIPLLNFEPSHSPTMTDAPTTSQRQLPTQRQDSAQPQSQCQPQPQAQTQPSLLSQGFDSSSAQGLNLSQGVTVSTASLSGTQTHGEQQTPCEQFEANASTSLSQLLDSTALPFEVSSFNQLLGHKAGPSARRGFDHEVLHPLKLRPWQAKIRGRSDEDIVREALMSRMDKC